MIIDLNERREDYQIAHDPIIREAIFKIGSDKKLASANAAFFRLFGYTSVEEYNESGSRTIFADIVDEEMVWMRVARQEIVTNVRVLFKTYKKGSFWGLLSFQPDSDSSCTAAVIDISRLVEKEQSLKNRTLALTRANMELDRFIYSASHDVRAPISTVMGLVNLIRIEPDPAQQNDLIGMIGATMTKLDAFLHQLYMHSRNARQELDISEINIPKIISSAIDHLKEHPSFGAVNITISAQPAHSFRSDSDRLISIFHHVIKNALDFVDMSKPERNIDIQAGIVRERLVVEIFDNGVGIPADNIPRVFEMFFKGSLLSRGSGLGLFLVREIASRLNGVVTIYSRFAVGTLVRLDIPAIPGIL